VRVAAFPSEAGSALGQGIAYSAVIGGTLSLASIATLPNFLSHLGPDASRTAILAALSIPLMMLTEILLSVNIAYGKTAVFNACRLLSPIGMLLVLGYLLMANEVTPFTVVLANIIGVSVAFVFAASALPFRRMAFRMMALLGDLRFGMKLQLGGLLEMANLRLDILLMSILAPAAQIGLYSAANNAMMPVITIGAAAATLLTPAVARMGRSGDDQSVVRHRQIDVTRAQARRYCLFAAAGGAILAVLAPFLIPLVFGAAFEPTVVLVWILIPGFLGRAFVVNVVAGATGMRHAWVGNVVEGTGFLCTIFLLPMLLFRFGATGAAIASTCAYLSSAVAAWFCLRLLTERAASSISVEPIIVRPSA
jgi:O-antigen/teichoic acid export membrane protein